jgi:hypothetical protein
MEWVRNQKQQEICPTLSRMGQYLSAVEMRDELLPLGVPPMLTQSDHPQVTNSLASNIQARYMFSAVTSLGKRGNQNLSALASTPEVHGTQLLLEMGIRESQYKKVIRLSRASEGPERDAVSLMCLDRWILQKPCTQDTPHCGECPAHKKMGDANAQTGNQKRC